MQIADSRTRSGHVPTFTYSFLYPRYWGHWLLFAILLCLAWIPYSIRDPLIGCLGCRIGRLSVRQRQRARVNLQACFPKWSQTEREQVIDKMFTIAAQVIIAIAELGVRSRRYLQGRTRIIGGEYLKQAQQQGKRVILMVPHAWGVDVPAVLLASYGIPVAAMFKPHANPLIDWIWNHIRLRFGGQLHPRQQGIKPFLQSIRAGYLGYYLPDQDHGAKKSEFVDFFATYKATLPVLGQMMRLCQATVIPLFPVYNTDVGCFELHLRPAMDDLGDASPAVVARRMNQEIEALVTPYPAQYMWILKLLKTRRPREKALY